MRDAIRLRHGSASCGLCGGNGRIAGRQPPATLIACPRCSGPSGMPAAPDEPRRQEARVVPLLAWHALNVAGYFALGVGAFMLIATARFVAG